MGNRAVITVAPYAETNIGIYLHWNGGRESVEGFLAAAKALGMRPPVGDPYYAMARLVQIIGNFFGGSTSIGIGLCSELDVEADNGTYLIDGDWEIVGREFWDGDDSYDTERSELVKAEAIEKTKGFM